VILCTNSKRNHVAYISFDSFCPLQSVLNLTLIFVNLNRPKLKVQMNMTSCRSQMCKTHNICYFYLQTVYWLRVISRCTYNLISQQSIWNKIYKSTKAIALPFFYTQWLMIPMLSSQGWYVSENKYSNFNHSLSLW